VKAHTTLVYTITLPRGSDDQIQTINEYPFICLSNFCPSCEPLTVKKYDCMDDRMHESDFLNDAELPLSHCHRAPLNLASELQHLSCYPVPRHSRNSLYSATKPRRLRLVHHLSLADSAVECNSLHRRS
jgi:hypothetical protein